MGLQNEGAVQGLAGFACASFQSGCRQRAALDQPARGWVSFVCVFQRDTFDGTCLCYALSLRGRGNAVGRRCRRPTKSAGRPAAARSTCWRVPKRLCRLQTSWAGVASAQTRGAQCPPGLLSRHGPAAARAAQPRGPEKLAKLSGALPALTCSTSWSCASITRPTAFLLVSCSSPASSSSSRMKYACGTGQASAGQAAVQQCCEAQCGAVQRGKPTASTHLQILLRKTSAGEQGGKQAGSCARGAGRQTSSRQAAGRQAAGRLAPCGS